MPGTVYTEDKLDYTFFPLKEFSLNLGIQANHDGHIALSSSDSQDASPMLEIFIGGWENQKSAIRLNREKPDKVVTETPDILSDAEERKFSIKWNTDGDISVTLEGASEPFLSWKNDEPFPITHFGLKTSWGASGQWKIDGTKEVATEDSTEYTFFPVFNGNLNFEVRAKNDAHIALTSGPEDEVPLHEVFLGGWENTKCAIRMNKEKPDKAEAEMENIVTGSEFKKFSLRWNYAGIQVCRDDECDPFISWSDPETCVTTYFGVRTAYGSDGYWHIQGVEGEAEDPAPAEDAPPAETEASTEENEVTGEPAEEKTEVPEVEGVTWVAMSAGEVPDGALVGGNDNGEDLFVARADHEGAKIPGKLFPEHGVAYIPWGGEEISKDEYEVMVVNPDEVSWEATTGDTIPENAIAGGISMDGELLYIGRAPHEGSLAVGKVHPSHAVLYISYGGAEIGYPEYEILVKN